MIIVMNIAILLLTIGIWIYVVWFSKSISNIKKMSDSMKNIFDSMKTDAEYFEKVRNTVKDLYGPEVVENIVLMRNKETQLKYEKEIKAISEEKLQSDFDSLMTIEDMQAKNRAKTNFLFSFSALSIMFLRKDQVDLIFGLMPEGNVETKIRSSFDETCVTMSEFFKKEKIKLSD